MHPSGFPTELAGPISALECHSEQSDRPSGFLIAATPSTSPSPSPSQLHLCLRRDPPGAAAIIHPLSTVVPAPSAQPPTRRPSSPHHQARHPLHPLHPLQSPRPPNRPSAHRPPACPDGRSHDSYPTAHRPLTTTPATANSKSIHRCRSLAREPLGNCRCRCRAAASWSPELPDR